MGVRDPEVGKFWKKIELSRPRFNFGAKQKSELQNFVLEGHPNALLLNIIDHIALAKQGDNALGSVKRPFVCVRSPGWTIWPTILIYIKKHSLSKECNVTLTEAGCGIACSRIWQSAPISALIKPIGLCSTQNAQKKFRTRTDNFWPHPTAPKFRWPITKIISYSKSAIWTR